MSYKQRKYISYLLQKKIEQKGCLTEADFEALARDCAVSLSEVFGVASFMHGWPFENARHVIKLCQSLPCYMKGAFNLFDRIKRKLKLDDDSLMSADKKFFLRPVNCLGRCGQSPLMVVDADVYEGVTEEKIDQILGKYK